MRNEDVHVTIHVIISSADKLSVIEQSVSLIVRDTGVARIFPDGALFFPEKVDDLFLVVAIKTQAKSTKKY